MGNCHCGRKTIGIMYDGNKPIHQEDGRLFYCEPKFKCGDYVKIKDGVNAGSLWKVNSLDSIGYYRIINANGNCDLCLPGDLEKVDMPKYYEEGNELKLGYVFKLDGDAYIVTNSYKTTGTHAEDFTLKVHAKLLDSDGKYNPNGKDIEFYQRDHIEVIDIKQLSFI